MNKKILVFYFDGTLVNSMEQLSDIASEVMSEHFGISEREARQLYQLTSGLPFSEQLNTLYPEEKKRNKKASQIFEKKKRENYFLEESYPDTLETIRYLKEKGYAVIISSNSAQELLDKFVKQLEIPCDLVLGHKGNFVKGLPHFLYILEKWGGNPNDIVFIGDSLKDGEWAFESGIDFIAKEGMFTKREFQSRFPGIPVISELAQLKEMF
ncbi:MAG: hypothetical protein A3F82_01915 [Deltaproteobacteria bacterium RIFCSPLOWO2_12_FULL_44_12]|nr:MAG: hypothetical protein A3F82_01915 [Deltaproteobacteria bacterium RIFCSPLOWO2_12_FULL_44_12]